MSGAAKLDPVESALDSLERFGREAGSVDPSRPASLKGALQWGWHAAALLAQARLLPERERFDVWVWDYLQEGDPTLEVDRDARWEERQRFSLLELLDILSEEGLPILRPEFYQGWQDRTTRCRTLRNRTASVVGSSIGEEQREELLLLLAGYHRLVRLPAAVELDAAPLVSALPALLDLLDSLVDGSWDGAPAVREAVARCRAALTSPGG